LKSLGVSPAIAVAVILVALVTAASVIHAYIVPEVRREIIFNHMRYISHELSRLYTSGQSIVKLSAEGIPLFSPAASPGFVVSLGVEDLCINITAYNLTLESEHTLWLHDAGFISFEELNSAKLCIPELTCSTSAYLDFETVSYSLSLEAFNLSAISISDGNVNARNETFITLTVGVSTATSTSSYNFTVRKGDAISIDLLDPLFNATSEVLSAKNLSFSLENCYLYISYINTTLSNISLLACGGIKYSCPESQLSYLITPIGLLSSEAGNTSLASTPLIYWSSDELVVRFYNISGVEEAVGGVGSTVISFKELNSISYSGNSSHIVLNVTFSDNLPFKNALYQTYLILSEEAPNGVDVKWYSDGESFSSILISGDVCISLEVKNVVPSFS